MARTKAGYYRTGWWRARWLVYFRVHPKKCDVCGSARAVQLHHLTYVRVYREPDEDLVPLCRTHHRQAHNFVKHRRCTLAQSVAYVKKVYGGWKPPRRRRKVA